MRKNILFLILILIIASSFKEEKPGGGPPVNHFISKIFDDTTFINHARKEHVKAIVLYKLHEENRLPEESEKNELKKEGRIVINDIQAVYVPFHTSDRTNLIGYTYFKNSRNYFLDYYSFNEDRKTFEGYKKEKYTFLRDDINQKLEEKVESYSVTGRADTSLLITRHKYIKTGNYTIESIVTDHYYDEGKNEERKHTTTDREAVTMRKNSRYELLLKMGNEYPRGSYTLKDDHGNITETGRLDMSYGIFDYMKGNNMSREDPENRNKVYRHYIQLISAGKIKEKRIPEISYKYQNNKLITKKVRQFNTAGNPATAYSEKSHYYYDAAGKLIKVDEYHSGVYTNESYSYEITYNAKGFPDKIYSTSKLNPGQKKLLQSFEYEFEYGY